MLVKLADFYVNPKLIVGIRSMVPGNSHTQLILTTGEKWIIPNSVEAVAEQLNRALVTEQADFVEALAKELVSTFEGSLMVNADGYIRVTDGNY